MIFIGIDWSETTDAVCLVDEAGSVLARTRVTDDLEGVRALEALLARHADAPEDVVIGIETDRGLVVRAVLAAGYRVYAINPLAASRYRDRHTTSGAKSDPGDAEVLAHLLRTDRDRHRPIAGDSDQVEAVKVLARAHQSLIWTRQRQTNQLRNALREFYPAALRAFGTDLDSADAVAMLARAPTPAQGRSLSQRQILSALKAGGRQRNLARRAAEIQAALRSQQLEMPPPIADAYGATVASTVAVIRQLTAQIASLEAELARQYEAHPDAEILTSLPGLGRVLGARVLAEFGDDPTRYADSKARKSYAGTAPITRASGMKRIVKARIARNKRLADTCYHWAFAAIGWSPGARWYYDLQRSRGKTHHQALRAVGNRLVGILHGCLRYRLLYDEAVAWPQLVVLMQAQEPVAHTTKSCKTTGGPHGSERTIAHPA